MEQVTKFFRSPDFLAVIGRGIQFATQLAMVLIVPKALAPEAYVELNLILPIAALGVSLIFGWLANSIHRHVYELLNKESPEVRQTTFFYYSCISVILITIYLISSRLTPSIYTLIPLMLTAAALKNGVLSILNASSNFRLFLFANAYFAISLSVFIGLCFVNNGDELALNMTIYAVLDVVIAAILWVSIGVFRFKPPPYFDRKVARKYLSYGLPMVANVVAVWIISLSDRYILNFWEDADAVAGYILGYQLGGSVINIPMLFLMTVIYPKILKIDKEDGEKVALQYVYQYAARYLRFMPVIFIFTSLVILPIAYFVYPDYNINPYVILLIILAHVIHALTHFYNKEFELDGRTRIITKAVGAGAIINIVLNLILIPYVGVLGAAISTLVAYSLNVYLVNRSGKFRFGTTYNHDHQSGLN